ncbi:hypothetical protein Tco_0898823 [Tanacetum coccineum]
MARQCLKPKRKKNATWFRDKVLLVKAQGNSKVLNEEELEFLADPGIVESPTKAVLMANLSSYRLDVLSELNRLSEDFSKRFIPQQELSDEQASRLQSSHPNTDQSASSPVKIEAPQELPKLQAKDITIEKLKANIKRLNKTSTKNCVKKGIDEIETINIELEHRVTKLIAENEHLKQTYKQLYDSN